MVRRVEVGLAASVLVTVSLYWLAWSVIGPVTNADSQDYNLARLWLIERYGLFANRSYTTIFQLIYPWSFDAVHYPFVHLRYGYALPSFLCLLGIMAILFKWARERGDAADGLRACLGLLAMPMVVLQASTTKNDLILAFCLFGWIEAMRRYASRPGHTALCLAALALAFLAGSKLTGTLYAGVGIAVSLWMVRRRPSHLAWFAGALALMLALLGSVEIYLNNYLEFGHWKGDPQFYRYSANNDGWRGFAANELRYAASLLDIQLLPEKLLDRLAVVKFNACQYLLQAGGFQGLGITSLPWRPFDDGALLRLMRSFVSTETRATYGIVGGLLMTVGPVVLLVRRRWDFPAMLFVGGVVAQLLIGATLGWHIANHRYLVAAVCLAWAGASLLVVGRCKRWTALGLTILVATCAVYAPLNAERSPAGLAVAFRDRDELLRDVERELIARARLWKGRGEVPVILTAGRARVFHLFDQLESDLISLPQLSEEDLRKLDAIYKRGQYRIVAINRPELTLPGLVREATLPDNRTTIYVWRRE